MPLIDYPVVVTKPWSEEDFYNLSDEEQRLRINQDRKVGLRSPKRDNFLVEGLEGIADASLGVLEGFGSTLSEAGITDKLDEFASSVRARHRDIEAPEDYRALSWRPSDIARTIGSAIGTTVPSMAVGAVAAPLTGGGSLAAGTASTAVMFAQLWGNKVREYREVMPDMDESGIKALAAFEALGESIIEFVGPWDVSHGIYSSLAKKASREAVEETVKRFGKQAVWDMLKKVGNSALGEGTEEIAQTYWDVFTRILGGDRNVPLPTWEQIRDQFAGGAIGGAGLGMFGSAFDAGVNRLDKWAHTTPDGMPVKPKGEIQIKAEDTPEVREAKKAKQWEVVNTLANATGVKVRKATQEEIDAEYQDFANRKGVSVDEAKKGGEVSGWYKDGDEILVNPNASRGILWAFGHEWKHWLTKKHSDLSKKFDQLAMSVLNEKGREQLVNTQELYGKAGNGQEEFLCDAYGTLLANPNTLENFCKKIEAQQQGAGVQFVETVREFVREVLDYLKQNQQEGSELFEQFSQLEEECADIMAQTAELNHYGRKEDGTPRAADVPVSVKTSEVKLNPAFFQHRKGGDSKTGVVPGHKISGKYNPHSGGTFLFWEDKNGQKWLVNGHHRWQMAQNQNIFTVPGYVLKESEGVTKEQARTEGLKINLQESSATVEDAAEFFRTNKMTEAEAKAESLLKEDTAEHNYAKTRNGYWIGTYAGDNLYENFRDGSLSAGKAATIAEVARGNMALEDAGLKMAKTMPAAQLRSALSLLKQSLEKQDDKQNNGEQLLFNGLFDDSAIKLAERQSAIAAKHISELRNKVSIAKKAAELGKDKANIQQLRKKLGVNVKNFNEVKQKLGEWQQELNAWEHYDTNPELIDQINRELNGVETPKPAAKPKPEPVKKQPKQTKAELKTEVKAEEKLDTQVEEQKTEPVQAEQTQKTEEPTVEELPAETQKESTVEKSPVEEQKAEEPKVEQEPKAKAVTTGKSVTAERIMPVLLAPGSQVGLVAASSDGEGIVIRHTRPGLVSFFIPQKLLKGRNSVFGTSVEQESLLGRREAPVKGRDRFSRFLVTPEDTEALRRAVELIERNYGLALDPRMDAAAAEAVQKAMPEDRQHSKKSEEGTNIFAPFQNGNLPDEFTLRREDGTVIHVKKEGKHSYKWEARRPDGKIVTATLGENATHNNVFGSTEPGRRVIEVTVGEKTPGHPVLEQTQKAIPAEAVQETTAKEKAAPTEAEENAWIELLDRLPRHEDIDTLAEGDYVAFNTSNGKTSSGFVTDIGQKSITVRRWNNSSRQWDTMTVPKEDYLQHTSAAELVENFRGQTNLAEKIGFHFPEEIQSAIEEKAAGEKQETPNPPSDSGEYNSESGTVFSYVPKGELLDRLETEPTVKVFRAMQVIDGKLYPPMAGKVDGKWQEPVRLGQWMQADERPELVKDGKFKLDKGNGSSIQAAYNPYFHTSRSPLNDQFSSAYKRANLVTVECEVPQSELSSGYRAEGAKDTVGEMAWHSGPVSSQLAKTGQPRQVILSRYVKVNRIVPDAEVAQQIARQLEGTGIAIPENVVTPSLRNELEKQGVAVTLRPETVNQRFNEELKNYDSMVDGHIFNLGIPNQLLCDYGIPMQPIELSRRVIENKSKDENHPFAIHSLKNLPDALRHPIAIFQYSDKSKRNIIIDLTSDSKHFLVGIQINSTYRGTEVNNIRGLFPKDTERWLHWILAGKAMYLDKNKVQNVIAQVGTNFPQVSNLNLDSVNKIVQNFDNASHKVKKTEFSYTPRQWKEMDKAYLDAVQRGDMETAERMVREREAEMGYSADESWKMDHRAPNSKDDVSLIDLKASGLVPADYWDHPKWYTSSPEEGESFRIIKAALELAERRKAEGNERPVGIWVYRAVDKTKNRLEGRLRNGDWVTPSRAYAENEGRDNPNGYRIIRQHCLLRNLYWDGNSIAELGFDDGNDYSYKDTANNRKLRDVVTYDDEGNVIPLSKRFNSREFDTRFSYTARRQQVNPILEEGQYKEEYQAGLEADLYERQTHADLLRQARNEITRMGGMQAALEAFLKGKRRIVSAVDQTIAKALVNSPEYQELSKDQREAFSALYRKAGTEAGQTLEARKHANWDLRDINNLRNFVNDFATDMQVEHPEQNVRQKIKDSTGVDIDNLPEGLTQDHAALDKFLRTMSSEFALKRDKFYEYWVNAILSALTTHAANTFGNVGNGIYELAVKRPVEALVNLIVRNPQGATFGELKHMWQAFDWRKAWEASKPLLFYDMLDTEGKFDMEHGTKAAIGGMKGRIIRTPGRFLRFADQLVKNIIRPVEASAMAYREAKAQGLNEAQTKEYILKELADEKSHANEYGRQRALELTFNEDPGAVIKALISLRNSNKVLAYLFPFIRTPANLLRQGIRKGPLGAINLVWETVQLARGQRKADNEYIAHWAEQIVFWSAMMALMAGHGDDDEPWITGNNLSFGAEGAFKRAHLPPMSIRIGSKWYAYNRIEPLATGLASFADGYNAYRNADSGKKLTSAMKMMMTGAAKVMKDKTYLDTISQLTRVLEDPERTLGDWAANVGASWVPNAYRQTVNAFHDAAPNYKAGSKNWILHTFQQTFSRAGLYYQVPKLDYFGRPVPKDLPLDQVGPGSIAWRLIMPVARREAKNMDPVEKLIWNYNKTAETPYWPSLPSPHFQMNGKRYEVENYDAFATRAGQLAHQQMLQAVKQRRLNVENPGKYDIDLIRKIFTNARKQAKVEALQKKQVIKR